MDLMKLKNVIEIWWENPPKQILYIVKLELLVLIRLPEPGVNQMLKLWNIIRRSIRCAGYKDKISPKMLATSGCNRPSPKTAEEQEGRR